jgi:hypothetical protein
VSGCRRGESAWEKSDPGCSRYYRADSCHPWRPYRRECDREQAYVLRAIREDIDLSQHMADAVTSLEIVLAADLSMREGRSVKL